MSEYINFKLTEEQYYNLMLILNTVTDDDELDGFFDDCFNISEVYEIRERLQRTMSKYHAQNTKTEF